MFAISLKNMQQSVNSTGPTFNIYSTVGAIQTGAGSVAHVTQQIDAEAKEKLINAIAVLEQLLAAVAALPTTPKGEVVEIVADAKVELSKVCHSLRAERLPDQLEA